MSLYHEKLQLAVMAQCSLIGFQILAGTARSVEDKTRNAELNGI